MVCSPDMTDDVSSRNMFGRSRPVPGVPRQLESFALNDMYAVSPVSFYDGTQILITELSLYLISLQSIL